MSDLCLEELLQLENACLEEEVSFCSTLKEVSGLERRNGKRKLVAGSCSGVKAAENVVSVEERHGSRARRLRLDDSVRKDSRECVLAARLGRELMESLFGLPPRKEVLVGKADKVDDTALGNAGSSGTKRDAFIDKANEVPSQQHNEVSDIALESNNMNDIALESNEVNDIALESNEVNNIALESNEVNDIALESNEVNNIALESNEVNDIALENASSSGIKQDAFIDKANEGTLQHPILVDDSDDVNEIALEDACSLGTKEYALIDNVGSDLGKQQDSANAASCDINHEVNLEEANSDMNHLSEDERLFVEEEMAFLLMIKKQFLSSHPWLPASFFDFWLGKLKSLYKM